MTSTDSHHVAGGEFLDLHIEAARQQFDAAKIERSARRLREKLSLARRTRRSSLSWPSLVGAASILFVAISVASFIFPGSDGSALAQAQQWFTSFRTLQVETIVLAEDSATNVLVWFDESGDTRIESSGTTTIVKPQEGMIYMLRPEGQNFARRITSDGVVASSTGFLDVIRTFQGTGDRLTESRAIEGVAAVGYKLASDVWTVVLWVDPSDGRPLLVESERPDGMTMRSVLNFNVPLPANAFDVPDGVQLRERE